MVTIAVVDDSRAIRENLARVFELFDGIELVWTETDGESAIRRIQTGRPRPDVVLMDIEMRKVGGIEATRDIKLMAPEVKILMLSVSDTEAHLKAALAAGADGYILKGEKPMKMLQLIQDVLEDRFPLSPVMAKKARRMMVEGMSADTRKQPSDFRLTKRETQVLALLTEGGTYQGIARALSISPLTVRSHMDNLYRKLGVNSKAEATAIAVKNGWV